MSTAKRTVLIAGMGTSPAVLTETVWALAQQSIVDVADKWESDVHKKDPSQRLAYGCIRSKGIGEYNTCPHLCHYYYANANNVAAMANLKRHCACPLAETITGK